MPPIRDLKRIARVTGRGARATATGTARVSRWGLRSTRWVGRNVGVARRAGGVGNVGMMRLLDLHAVSCAGDTLITIGLAGTIFFNVPAGQARGRVALYLLITMVPFALLAPVVGPLLDRFRHGRRYALAGTMLGRAILAWIIADNLFGFGLYPAAFGVLALSRAYGVARSAAVPRLLPPGLGLSQAGARASVYGTVAGAIVAPVGALAFWVGPQWPLRIAGLIFLAGVVVSFTLPPRADSDPPETVPRLFQWPWRRRAESGTRVLSGALVVATIIGSATLRALYGFLLLFLAFAIRADGGPRTLLGVPLSAALALGVIGGALAIGTFLSTAIGTRLRIRRPVALQAVCLIITGLTGLGAVADYSLFTLAVLCLVAATASGLSKLAVDACIQERIAETVRASAFAHAETLLMLAWVAGGAIGLVPLDARIGVGVAAAAVLASCVRAVAAAVRLRGQVLLGRDAGQTGTVGSGTVVSGTVVSGTVGSGTVGSGTVVVPGQPTDVVPPGYHVFQPSPPDSGVADPRMGS